MVDIGLDTVPVNDIGILLALHRDEEAYSESKQGQNTRHRVPRTSYPRSRDWVREPQPGFLSSPFSIPGRDRNLCQWMLPPRADLIRRELAENVKNSY